MSDNQTQNRFTELPEDHPQYPGVLDSETNMVAGFLFPDSPAKMINVINDPGDPRDAESFCWEDNESATLDS